MTDITKQLADALRLIEAHEVIAPLTENDDNVGPDDLPYYVAGKAHAELAILRNIARNALALYTASHSTPEPGAVSDDVVPDELRALSEAAAMSSDLGPAGEWDEFGAILCDSEGEPVADVYRGKPTADFIRAAVNYVRAKLAAPSEKATGQ